MTRRIASVQHGDYVEALQIIGEGRGEPYFGMRYTLEVLAELFGTDPHLVVSLNAPRGRVARGRGQLVGLPLPHLPKPLPWLAAACVWARQVRSELERFAPTHILLRAAGPVAIAALEYGKAHGVSTLVTLANRFETGGLTARLLNHRLVPLLNAPHVFLVGNHKQPATDSMIGCGVAREKAVAWDWPGTRHPRDQPEKSLSGAGPWQVAYVGSISAAKGVGDLVDAIALLRARGFPASLVACGDGPDRSALERRAATLPPGAVRFVGRVANEDAFRIMRESSLVCVPSRHEFSEGMPLTLTEALASRTPVIVSDHPVLTAAFVDGEGVLIVPEKDPRAWAAGIERVLSDAGLYRGLSETTSAAYARVECTTTFGDLVDRWRQTFCDEEGGSRSGPRHGTRSAGARHAAPPRVP